jgi:hypothetical protein
VLPQARGLVGVEVEVAVHVARDALLQVLPLAHAVQVVPAHKSQPSGRKRQKADHMRVMSSLWGWTLSVNPPSNQPRPAQGSGGGVRDL